MTKLVDQFGTKYFAHHYAYEVKTFLDREDVREIDLAGARICHTVMSRIMTAAHNGLVVHDTTDPVRDAFFEENRRRRKLQQSLAGAVDLPIPQSIEQVSVLVKRLDPNVTYVLRMGALTTNRAFAVLVQFLRPEITIDLGSDAVEVLSLVYDNLFPNNHVWDEFYRVAGATYEVVQVGSADYRSFISDNIVVPTVFGKERLLNLPEWSRCFSRVVSLLESGLKPTNKRIADYIYKRK